MVITHARGPHYLIDTSANLMPMIDEITLGICRSERPWLEAILGDRKLAAADSVTELSRRWCGDYI